MAINDTMIKYSAETGYPVTDAKARKKVKPTEKPADSAGRKMVRWSCYLLAATLAVMSALWLIVGAATHVEALQVQEPTTVATAPVDPTSAVAVGTQVGTISIPAIGLEDVPVVEGTDSAQINVAVGHYVGTEFPADETGNVALAGHRTGWDEYFHDLDELQVGDTVIIETADATYTYTVTGSAVVNPSETWVLNDVPTEVSGASGESQLLTLTTCEGKDNEQRLIVFAELTNVS